MQTPQPDQAVHENSGKRFRTLYGDADSARRNIMRLPSTPSHDPSTMQPEDHESPLGFKSLAIHTDANDNAEETEDHSDLAHPIEEGGLAGAAERASSDDPRSSFSDPFDLYVSDDEGHRGVNNIDAVIGRGGYDFVAHEYEDGSADDDEGAHAHAYVPSSSRSHSRFLSALTRCFVPQDHRHPRNR